MFRKVKEVYPLPGMRLSVIFANGATKVYDVVPLLSRFDAFKVLQDPNVFGSVEVDVGGYGIVWNDDIDLSCDELWENGIVEETPSTASYRLQSHRALGLSESTLRKAISYGKLVSGVDARKYGKQWIVTEAAMRREYGEPVSA